MIFKRHKIPSTSALPVFESPARHCNFSRAAEELFTSQSAISPHISTLEGRFKTLLFERHKRKNLVLPVSGKQLYRKVVASLTHLSGMNQQ